MAAGDRQVNIVVAAKDAASKTLGGLNVSLVAIAAAAAAAAAGLAVMASVMNKATKLAALQEQSDVKLAFALRALGQNTAEGRAEIQAFASDLQDLTTVADDVIQGVIGMLAQVGQIGGPDLKRATKATLDLAAAMNIDLKAAAILVAKAAQGDVSALSRYGLKIDESIPPTQKFAALLDLLETKFKGTSEVASKTFTGAITKVKNNFGDMLEKLGDVIAKNKGLRLTLELVAEGFKELGDVIVENQPILLSAVDSIIQATIALLDASIALAESFPKNIGRVADFARFAGPVVSDVALLLDAAANKSGEFGEALAEGAGKAREKLQELSAKVEEFKGQAEEAANSVGNLNLQLQIQGDLITRITEGFGPLTTTITETWDDLLDKAAALESDYVMLRDLMADRKISPEFFDQAIEKLDKTSVGLNALRIAVVGFENVSVEAAKRMLEELEETSEEAEKTASILEEVGEVAENQVAFGAQRMGGAFVDAFFGAKREFDKFLISLLSGLAKAIVQALILKAVMSAFAGGGGGAGFFGIPLGGGLFGLQHGGIVTGGRRGRDSVAALLAPGEVVLPAASPLAREIRNEGAGRTAVPSAGIQFFNQIVVGGDRRAQAIEMLEEFNELVERHGFRMVSTEVIS